MKPKVSIVLPIYNAESYLQKCIDSIIAQTLLEIEIILIDDGSTDGSAEICKRYLDDQRVRYIYKENEGLAAARQDGMDLAKGEYIGFVDSDDWLEPDMYEKMYRAAEQADADIVLCNCYENNDVKCRKYLETGGYNRKKIEEIILPRSLGGISEKGSNSVIRWSNCLRLYRMEMIHANRLSFGRTFRRSQDLPFTFETTLHAQRYVYLGDDYLYHNRVTGNENSLSRGYTKDYWKLIRPLIDRLQEDVNCYPELNLQDSMDLCVFFFAVNGLQNEFSKGTLSVNERLRNVQEILWDTVVGQSLERIPVKKLNSYYRICAATLKRQHPVLAYCCYFAGQRINALKQGIRRCIACILNIPCVEKRYCAIKKIFNRLYR